MKCGHFLVRLDVMYHNNVPCCILGTLRCRGLTGFAITRVVKAIVSICRIFGRFTTQTISLEVGRGKLYHHDACHAQIFPKHTLANKFMTSFILFYISLQLYRNCCAERRLDKELSFNLGFHTVVRSAFAGTSVQKASRVEF
jgi:hypothetical protein